MRNRKLPVVTGLLACLLAGSSAPASELYVFPGKGQSEAQMEQDKFSCYQWARKNTGYDPTNPPRVSTTTTSSQPYRPGGDVVRGAAKGAIVAGIADGDAGKGAAVGAIGGGVFGGMRHQRRVESQRQQAAANQSARSSAMRSDYNRAYSACLEGKGYTVR
ncbi:MAG: hypothetical protein GY703_05630 [Gammaproteobacteria bacterium]|nr:hypothetical protein [Gammaproteobacteria bacterium]